MSRKVSAVFAGWLAAASIGLAQSGQPGGPAAGKGRTSSPYYPTASTSVDWSGDTTTDPPDMPNIPVPRAPSPVRTVSGQEPATPVVPSLPGTQPPAMAMPRPVQQSNPVASMATSPTGLSTAPCTTCNMCDPCGPCGPCGPMGRVWGSAEYLLWWTSGMNLPALVTASPGGTPRAQAGVLGLPTTAVLFGDDEVNDAVRSGVRARAGFWLDACQTCGLEGSFFLFQADEDATFDCPPGSTTILARPFFNLGSPAAGLVNVPIPDSELVCLPGVLTGSVNVRTTTDFYGFDANFIRNLWCNSNYRVDGLVGYRYLNLQDTVTITENLTVTATNNPALPFGTTFLVQDRFESTNEFNGGQVGIVGEWRSGRWYVYSRSLIAMGNTRSVVNINGFTNVTVPGAAPISNAGGLLAQGTNIGTYTTDEFSIVPESQLTVGYQVTGGIRAFIGYSALYWTNVTRAGDQIDLVVNATQIPPGVLVGPARPTFLGNKTDFWAQGVSFGVEMRY